MRPALCIVWLLAAAAGAQVPGPAGAPHRVGQTRLGTGLDTTDVIPWRQLRRDDFRGERPPGAFGTDPVRPVAVSCAYVVPVPGARVFPAAVAGADADAAWRARVEGLAFHTLLSRSCSWWNPEAAVSPAYVLQHEQLHFDIFEIAARRLNRDLPGMLQTMDVRGPTQQAVVDGAQRFVQAALSRAMAETAARNRKLDLETSFGFQPQRQETWRKVLDRDLRDLQAHAAGAPPPPPP